MPVYKSNDKYIVKVCINGRQILRRKYLGKEILDKSTALQCEKDLLLSYGELQHDYEINDLFNLYEEYLFKKYKETSAKRYLNTFNNVIKKYFINRKVSEITRSYCEFINDAINNLNYKRIDVYLFVCKSFIIFINNYGCKASTTSFYQYRKSRVLKQKYNYYTIGEFNRLLSVISVPEDKLLFSLLFYYGLRIGELRGLEVCDFKSDRISINKELTNKGRFGGQEVLDPKTSSSYREYPYIKDIEALFKAVKDSKKLKKNDYVFLNTKKDKVIGETSIRRKLDNYSSKAHIKRIKIHEFRHSCATYLINEDVDPKDIASWLGHSSVDTTLRVYAHLLPLRKENVKKAFDK